MTEDNTIIATGTHRGINWHVTMGPRGAFANGYIEVPENHPWANTDYEYIENVDVHGGLTYSQDNIIGFDTAHYGDIWTEAELLKIGGTTTHSEISKYLSADEPFQQNTYWTLEKLIKEVENLAEQAVKAE
jgi:hypothetical protein